MIGTAEKPELVFRTIGLATEEAGLTAKYMLDVLGLRKVAVLHDRDDWGRSQAQIVYDAVKAYPGGQALMFEGVTIGETDFSGIGTKIIAAGADSIYFGGHYQEMSGVLNYLRDAGWKGQFLAPDSLRSDFPKLAGKNAEGSIFLEGAGPTMIPSGKEFVTNFTAKYPNDVLSNGAMTTYISTDLVLRGIEAVGNTTDREGIVKWIRDRLRKTPSWALSASGRPARSKVPHGPSNNGKMINGLLSPTGTQQHKSSIRLARQQSPAQRGAHLDRLERSTDRPVCERGLTDERRLSVGG